LKHRHTLKLGLQTAEGKETFERMMDIATYPEDLETKPIQWPVDVKDEMVKYTEHTFNENRVVYNPVSRLRCCGRGCRGA
jgi:hypothetical protein